MLSAVLPENFDELVLDAIARIPPRHVMSYGDVAEYLGVGGPRQVARVLSNGTGDLPGGGCCGPTARRRRRSRTSASPDHRAEATPLRPDGTRVDMRRARWDGR